MTARPDVLYFARFLAEKVRREAYLPLPKLPPSTRPEDLAWLAEREAKRQPRAEGAP